MRRAIVVFALKVERYQAVGALPAAACLCYFGAHLMAPPLLREGHIYAVAVFCLYI